MDWSREKSSFVFCLLVIVPGVVLGRLCCDADCKHPISYGRTIQRHITRDEGFLSYPASAIVTIFTKDAYTSEDGEYWEAEIQGKRGFILNSALKELTLKCEPSVHVQEQGDDGEPAAEATDHTHSTTPTPQNDPINEHHIQDPSPSQNSPPDLSDTLPTERYIEQPIQDQRIETSHEGTVLSGSDQNLTLGFDSPQGQGLEREELHSEQDGREELHSEQDGIYPNTDHLSSQRVDSVGESDSPEDPSSQTEPSKQDVVDETPDNLQKFESIESPSFQTQGHPTPELTSTPVEHTPDPTPLAPPTDHTHLQAEPFLDHESSQTVKVTYQDPSYTSHQPPSQNFESDPLSSAPLDTTDPLTQEDMISHDSVKAEGNLRKEQDTGNVVTNENHASFDSRPQEQTSQAESQPEDTPHPVDTQQTDSEQNQPSDRDDPREQQTLFSEDDDDSYWDSVDENEWDSEDDDPDDKGDVSREYFNDPSFSPEITNTLPNDQAGTDQGASEPPSEDDHTTVAPPTDHTLSQDEPFGNNEPFNDQTTVVNDNSSGSDTGSTGSNNEQDWGHTTTRGQDEEEQPDSSRDRSRRFEEMKRVYREQQEQRRQQQELYEQQQKHEQEQQQQQQKYEQEDDEEQQREKYEQLEQHDKAFDTPLPLSTFEEHVPLTTDNVQATPPIPLVTPLPHEEENELQTPPTPPETTPQEQGDSHSDHIEPPTLPNSVGSTVTYCDCPEEVAPPCANVGVVGYVPFPGSETGLMWYVEQYRVYVREIVFATFPASVANWIVENRPMLGVVSVSMAFLSLSLPLLLIMCVNCRSGQGVKKQVVLEKAARTKLEGDKVKLEGERNTLNHQLLETKETCQSLEDDVRLIREEMAQLNQAKTQLEAHSQTVSESLTASQQEIARYQTHTEQLNAQLAYLNEQLLDVTTQRDSSLKQSEELVAHVTDLQSKVGGLEAQNEQLEQDKYNTQNTLEALQIEHSSATSSLEEFRDRCSNLDSQLVTMTTDLDSSHVTLREKEEELQHLRQCLSQLTDQVAESAVDGEGAGDNEGGKEAQLAKIKAMLDTSKVQTELQQTVSERDDYFTQLQGKSCQLEQQIAGNQSLQEQYSDLESKQKDTSRELRELQIKMKGVTEYFQEKESDLHRRLELGEINQQKYKSFESDALEKAAASEVERGREREELKELRKQMADIEKSFLGQLKSNEERAEDALVQLRRTEQDLRQANREVTTLKRRLAEAENVAAQSHMVRPIPRPQGGYPPPQQRSRPPSTGPLGPVAQGPSPQPLRPVSAPRLEPRTSSPANEDPITGAPPQGPPRSQGDGSMHKSMSAHSMLNNSLPPMRGPRSHADMPPRPHSRGSADSAGHPPGPPPMLRKGPPPRQAPRDPIGPTAGQLPKVDEHPPPRRPYNMAPPPADTPTHQLQRHDRPQMPQAPPTGPPRDRGYAPPPPGDYPHPSHRPPPADGSRRPYPPARPPYGAPPPSRVSGPPRAPYRPPGPPMVRGNPPRPGYHTPPYPPQPGRAPVESRPPPSVGNASQLDGSNVQSQSDTRSAV